MLVLLLGTAILLWVLWRARKRPVLARGEWRMGAGLLAIGAFVGAILVAIRGAWPLGIGLGLISLALMVMARSPRMRGMSREPGMSALEARAVLGVTEVATAEEIRSAYARLISRVHPDRGGSTGLAAQLNAARDKLLKG